MIKQSYCTGDTGIKTVSGRQSSGLTLFSLTLKRLVVLQNISDCVPFEDGLIEEQEEEIPKTLLEVSDHVDVKTRLLWKHKEM